MFDELVQNGADAQRAEADEFQPGGKGYLEFHVDSTDGMSDATRGALREELGMEGWFIPQRSLRSSRG